MLALNVELYGTTLAGGASGDGTVFEVNPSTGAESVLYSFQGGADGETPSANLIAVNGALYGTTQSGGYASGYGTVFELDPSSGAESVLYSFHGGKDGAYPLAAVVAMKGASKTLYGTTGGGGAYGDGTIFKVSLSGAEEVLYSFKGSPDGYIPYGNLIVVNGLLYGATSSGGTHICKNDYAGGCGSIFSTTASGAERVLYSFKGSPDGAWPQTNLTDVKSVLYGTTIFGGTGNCKTKGYLPGCGTVFTITL